MDGNIQNIGQPIGYISMQKKAKVSVLINNHNYGTYIGDAIESVLNQSYRNFELIIVDGASTDESRKIIMSYVERFPDLITAVFKPSSGQAAAINVGFHLSRGDIIAFLDSDDYFYENKLERIVSLHEQYDFVGNARKALNYRKELTDVIAPADEYEQRPLLFHKYGYIYTYNLITSCISAKRELLTKILPMPEEDYITFADCYVKVMAQYYSNIKYLNEPLTFYRIHDLQETLSFDNFLKLNQFVERLYDRVFRDINCVLQERGEEVIPPLNAENFKQAFAIANPKADIREGENYVIFGAGNNSYKVQKYLKLLGGKCLYMVDSNPKKWGTLWNDISVISFDELVKKRSEFHKIIIASPYFREMEQTLFDLGMKSDIDFITIQSFPND